MMETELVFETLHYNSNLTGSAGKNEMLVHLLLVKASNITCYWMCGGIECWYWRSKYIQAHCSQLHNLSNLSGRTNICSPTTHVSKFGLIRERKNGIVMLSLATQHTPFLLFRHPLLYDRTHVCHFGPSTTNRHYFQAQHYQISVPLSVTPNAKIASQITKWFLSFKLYLWNTEPFIMQISN